MFRIYEIEGLTRRTVATDITTMELARSFLEGWGVLIAFEIDPDVDYVAADALLQRYKTGAVAHYTIEPEGR